MELNSIGYINESDLVNTREIDIEVLLVGSRVIGVTHECMHDFESSVGEDDSVEELMQQLVEFVFDYQSENFLGFSDMWDNLEDKVAACKAVKQLIQEHKAL